jgi:hypothetical protein
VTIAVVSFLLTYGVERRYTILLRYGGPSYSLWLLLCCRPLDHADDQLRPRLLA